MTSRPQRVILAPARSVPASARTSGCDHARVRPPVVRRPRSVLCCISWIAPTGARATIRPSEADADHVELPVHRIPKLHSAAEFYLSPDGRWTLFSRQVDGRLDLWRMRTDGSHAEQIRLDDLIRTPYPAPDGRRYVFVKVLPPRNFEVFLGDLQSDSLVRLTYHDGFNGFPAVSPDRHWLLLTSARDAAPGTRSLGEYLMDISSLKVGPPAPR